MFVRMRLSFAVFGMTTTPCWTPHESTTCAGVASCTFAMRSTSSSSSRSDGLPAAGAPALRQRCAQETETSRRTERRVRGDHDPVLLCVRAERGKWKTRVQLDLVCHRDRFHAGVCGELAKERDAEVRDAERLHLSCVKCQRQAGKQRR
jgi:hypothetical protein